MNISDLASLIQSIVSILTLATFVFLVYQTREMIKQTRLNSATMISQVYEEIASTMINIDAEFIRYPQFRCYFYDNCPISNLQNEEDRTRVVAISEMYLDFMDLLVVLRRMASDSGADKAVRLPLKEWDDYFVDVYRTSPVLQSFLGKHINWYNPELVQLLRSSVPNTEENH